MVPLIADVESPIIGRYYMVPCIVAPMWDQDAMVPLIGPKHNDQDVIGFSKDHWHVDWRFASRRLWDLMMRMSSRDGGVLAIAIANFNGGSSPRKRKCHREMPTYPTTDRNNETIHWLPKLEAAYAGACLKTCKVCPHRGIPLKGMKPNADGLIVCPGHGLAWHAETGKLVRRT